MGLDEDFKKQLLDESLRISKRAYKRGGIDVFDVIFRMMGKLNIENINMVELNAMKIAFEENCEENE